MTTKRQPPIHIPIPVDQFVEGLLKIDPAKLKASRKKAAKKRATTVKRKRKTG
jgi:hypothetical protein